MKRFPILCVLWAACGAFSCSDDSTTRVGPGLTNGTTTSGDKVATGGACTRSAQCVTTYCVAGTCAVRAGGVCGQGHCASGQVCQQPTLQCQPAESCPAVQACGGLCCEAAQTCVGGSCVETCGDGRARCGGAAEAGVCCGMEQGCVFNQCVALGATCTRQEECERTQYCEPTLERCVEQTNQGTCSYVPPAETFSPKLLWHWQASAVSPEFDQIMASPIVANLTDDNGDGAIDQDDIPDVIFASFNSSAYNGLGVLRVLSGDTGKEHWSSTGLAAPYHVRGTTTPAVADIDSDGLPDIVLSAYVDGDISMGSLVALSHTGEKKWEVPGASMIYGGVSIANVDGKGDPEIMAFGQLLNSKGQPICAGLPGNIHPALVDIDDDGTQEIVLGGRVWKVLDATKTDGTGCMPVESTQASPNGYNAIADLDGDGKPEFVVIAAPTIAIYEDDGTLKWEQVIPRDDARHVALFGSSCDDTSAAACLPDGSCEQGRLRCLEGRCRSRYCNPGGGPPTIADFDGDGTPDIAVAARWYYMVYTAKGEVLWAHKTTDFSSAVTGSSVFDFEGDGKAEVVYNDEQFLRVYRGAGSTQDADGDGFNDPVILVEIANTSGTLTEYPLIVDVNNDAKAEIVLMANDYSRTNATKGLLVFGDELNNWVSTRRIWNQHAYHVTNINEDATVPLVAKQNWKQPFLNNYRQNTQGATAFNAPDLAAQAAFSCQLGQIKATVTLENKGSLGVRAGAIKAAVYLSVDGAKETFIQTLTNSQPLSPGATSPELFEWTVPQGDLGKTLRWRILVDEDEAKVQSYNECDETNNTAQAEVVCKVLG